jgi:hypothetical protein
MTQMERDSAREQYDEFDDGELAPWDVVAATEDWSGLLVGNGASIAIWDGFRYDSLLETAADPDAEYQLSDEGCQLFERLETENFETVLSALRTARLVDDVLGFDVSVHDALYETVREALVAAVQAVHVPYDQVPESTLRVIRSVLEEFEFVFTTNYDLLLYWGIMVDRGGIPDYFWSKDLLVFDPLNVEVWQKATKLLYLHGGLHLVHLTDGRTLKRTAEQWGRNLLELFGQPPSFDDGAVPLFISEGESADKLAAIRRSDYLTFALTQLAALDRPIVIFGHSLSTQDRHIVDVLRAHRSPAAIAIYATDADAIIAEKARVEAALPHRPLRFFQSQSHPLGSPDIRVAS